MILPITYTVSEPAFSRAGAWKVYEYIFTSSFMCIIRVLEEVQKFSATIINIDTLEFLILCNKLYLHRQNVKKHR